MQLSLDLSQIGHTTRLSNIIQPKESTAYITISGCVLDHIVVTKTLSSIEKLFFLLANGLSLINSKRGRQRSVALSAESWATRLNCSKSRVFLLQQSLSDKGYFIITKDKNKHGQNKRNLICPTLPDPVFKELCKAPDRAGQEHLYFVPTSESKLQYLDRTKLFILLGYQVLKDISSCEQLAPFHKLVWLDFYARCYKSHMANFGSPVCIDVSDTGFSFITSYKQLEDRFTCDKRLLSEALIDLEEIGLIKRTHFYVKKESDDQDRQDKSLWKISLLSPEQIKSNLWNGETYTNSSLSGSTTSLNPINVSSKLLPIRSNALSSLASKGRAYANGTKEHVGSTNRKDSDSRSIESKPEIRTELKSKISSTHEQYIENIVSELNQPDKQDTNIIDTGSKVQGEERRGIAGPGICSYEGGKHTTTTDFQNMPDLEGGLDTGFLVIRNCDPDFRSSTLYLNKDITIYNFKSNLEDVDNIRCPEKNLSFRDGYIPNPIKTTKCLETSKKLNQYGVGCEDRGNYEHRGVSRRVIKLGGNIRDVSEFNVCTLLIKTKLQLLSKDKADKARKFAYSLFTKKLAKGYAATLSKNELAKQFIFHATSWKPTKVGRGASDDQLVDVALSVAWNAAVKGSWQQPLEWAKAKALQYEFLAYKRKFKESGIISQELRSLESMVNNLLGTNYALASVITKEVETKVKEIAGSERNKEEGRETSGIKEIEIEMSCETKYRSPQIDLYTKYTGLSARDDTQRITYASGNKEEQAINYSSLNAYRNSRIGEGGISSNNGDPTSVQQSASLLGSFQTNRFQGCTNIADNASIPSTVVGFSKDLLEQHVYFNLPCYNEGQYRNMSATDNYQAYIAKLKLFEINDNGELVITLQHNALSKEVLPLVNDGATLVQPSLNSSLELELNIDQGIIEGQEDLLMSSGQHLSKDFIKIDQTLSGILRSLKKERFF